MAGNALTTSSTMQCPHGGQVSPVPAQARARAGTQLLTSADGFTIAGCPLVVGGAPSPCLTVQWAMVDAQVTAGGATLSESDTGLCLNAQRAPQGAVTIVNTQRRVKTR